MEKVHLSPQERRVFELMSQGMETHEIAAALFIMPTTVTSYCYQAGLKLGTKSKLTTLMKLMRMGEIKL